MKEAILPEPSTAYLIELLEVLLSHFRRNTILGRQRLQDLETSEDEGVKGQIDVAKTRVKALKERVESTGSEISNLDEDLRVLKSA